MALNSVIFFVNYLHGIPIFAKSLFGEMFNDVGSGNLIYSNTFFVFVLGNNDGEILNIKLENKYLF